MIQVYEPQNLEEFRDYCYRRLGYPLQEINVDDEQANERIMDALNYFRDYHFSGSEHCYLAFQITDEMKRAKAIPIPDSIIGVTSVISFPSYYGGSYLFDIQYYMTAQSLYTVLDGMASGSVVPYYITMSRLEFLQELFDKTPGLLFNRHTNKILLKTDWSKLPTGQFIVVEAYKAIDPDEYPDVWSDRWLKRYATALIKQQWGTNLKIFQGVQMLGGVMLNGQQIFDDATREIQDLEAEMITKYSIPPMDQVY